jgi:hypothetical protein
MKNKKEINNFKKAMIIVTCAGLFLLLACTVFIYVDSGFYNKKLCVKTACIKDFFATFNSIYYILDALSKIIVTTATALGVYYALMNYLSSSSTSNANVYLQHLNMFRTYIFDESIKDSKINVKSINIIKWYNLAFPDSIKGSLSVGKVYKDKVAALIKTVENSNSKLNGKNPEEFDYNKHQAEMIKSLTEIGIEIQRLPKNDFFEVENCLISLINNVNFEICQDKSNTLEIPTTKFK